MRTLDTAQLLGMLTSYSIGGLVLLQQGYPVISAVYLLPAIAAAFALLLPNSLITTETFTRNIAGPLREDEPNELSYQLKCAGWWFAGTVVLPLSMLLLDWSTKNDHFLGDFDAVLAMPFVVMGVSFALCGIASLFRALKAFIQMRREAI